MFKIKSRKPGTENSISKFKIMSVSNELLQLPYLSWLYWWHVEFFVHPNTIFFSNVCLAYLRHGTETRCLSEHSPAATADHMTKNIPTAILFKEEGRRPRCFRMGSTTLSFRGISRRMSTASNMVSQAAGKRNVNWWVWTKEQIRWNRCKKRKEYKKKTKKPKTNYRTATQNVNALEHSSCISKCVWCLDIALAPPGGHGQNNSMKTTNWSRNNRVCYKINSVTHRVK